MDYRTLIDASALAARLADGDWLIADCRFDLKQPSWGEDSYATAHIPGAVYVHLDRDLSAAKTGTTGRHPLPSPDEAAATFGRLGIDASTQVVAYDQDAGMYASRLWWMLRWLGHDRVAVLDGGLAGWVAEGRPTRAGHESRPGRVFHAAVRPAMLATTADIEPLVQRGFALVDARAPERFRGEVEPIDRVAGHIPGAKNHFFQSNLDAHGRFKPASALAVQFAHTLGGVTSDRTVCYCGSGVTACHDLLAMEHAGLGGARLYAGSWSEWSSDQGRAIETGEPRQD